MAKDACGVHSPSMTLLLDLADYDGKQVTVLEAIKRSRKSDTALMAELVALSDDTARYRGRVELNVSEQCINVTEPSWVQKHYLGCTHCRTV